MGNNKTYEIITVNSTGVNCYVIKARDSFIMVDAGFPLSRKAIEKTLLKANCPPGGLKLVILTHADYDHTGNCLFLREKYGAKVAAHRNEAKALETADMLACRRTKQKAFFRAELAMGRFVMGRPFKPDVLLADGDDLSPYGLDAKIVHTPGHTIGSISILTGEGDLFCGDFLVNGTRPKVNYLTDDPAEMSASIAKLKDLDVKKIYPGHGKPFTLAEFLESSL